MQRKIVVFVKVKDEGTISMFFFLLFFLACTEMISETKQLLKFSGSDFDCEPLGTNLRVKICVGDNLFIGRDLIDD